MECTVHSWLQGSLIQQRGTPARNLAVQTRVRVMAVELNRRCYLNMAWMQALTSTLMTRVARLECSMRSWKRGTDVKSTMKKLKAWPTMKMAGFHARIVMKHQSCPLQMMGLPSSCHLHCCWPWSYALTSTATRLSGELYRRTCNGRIAKMWGEPRLKNCS